ncbi:MAG: hypothetical protein JXR07_20515 [Reichenbachiella sp.]
MLLNDTDLKAVLPVAGSFSHSQLLPDIRTVENREIKKLLGVTLYTSLDTAYESDSTTAVQKELLTYVQPIIANLSFWMFLDKGNVSIDDTGIYAVHTETKKPAFEWQVKAVRRTFKRTGFNAIDNLIEFLEDNSADYPDWTSSSADEEARKFFLNTAIQYHEYVSIKESRYMFMALLPIMKRVELQEVSATISKELFEEIKDQLSSLTISLTNADLLYNLKGSIAHLSWSFALLELPVIIDSDGIQLLDSSYSGSDIKLSESDAKRINAISIRHEKIGMSYLEKVKDYLQENADDYPLYKASDCYIDILEDESTEFENDPDSGIVML